jgi:hypothetical protein
MAEPDDVLSEVENVLVDHALDSALQPEPQGVAATEFDAVMRGDAAETLHKLTYTQELLEFDSNMYYPTILAMRRRLASFADAIEPLEGVLAFGRSILDDRARRDKTANVDEMTLHLGKKFPKLSSTSVQRRYHWALFGLRPFVQVTNSSSHIPHVLQFLPVLYQVPTMQDVFQAQQLARDEAGILEELRAAYRQTRKRRHGAMLLGQNARWDRALRSLIQKGDAELLDTVRVVITEKGIESDVHAGATLPGTFRPPPPWVDPADPLAEPRNPLERLLARLENAQALSLGFARLLQRDAQEIAMCLEVGAHKAALILCGSILEGVLMAVLLNNRDRADAAFKLRRQRKSFPENASLPDLVGLAADKDLCPGVDPLLGEVGGVIARLVAGHRDLVHPHAEVREELLTINEHTAAAVHATLCALLDDVARRIEGGWLERYRTH